MPSFGEMPFGKMPSFGEMPFGEMQVGKQMMDFYKTMFSNAVNVMDMIHEQNEKMTEMFLDNTKWLPEQGKEPIRNMIQTAKKGHNELKKLFDDNIKKMEGAFGVAEKAEPAAEKKTKK